MRPESDRIVPLDEMEDYEVAEGDPDVRGWDVVADDGQRIGEVDELLVDRTAMKVRYLDVHLDEQTLELAGEDRHVLVPIGRARLDTAGDQVIVEGLRAADVERLPPFTHEPVTRETEFEVRERFEPGFTRTRVEGREFYETDLFDENRFYAPRRHRR